MRAVRFKVSLALIRELLHMPATSRVTAARYDFDYSEEGSIELRANDPNLPEIPEGCVIPEVTPICHRRESGAIDWDWNLPKEKIMQQQPSKWRKKPVVIEAMHFADVADGSVIAAWCSGNKESPVEIQIPTLEGEMTASLGDYVIKGVKGEFYACKPEIFRATYEEA